MTDRVAYRTCPLCEATCGLEVTFREGAVHVIRGDRDDVFSRGYLCPKGSTLKQLDADPDRIRTPLLRRGGAHVPVTWEEAWEEIDRRLPPIVEAHGRDAIAIYLGNPNAHNLSNLIFGRVLIQAAGTTNVYSASTVDQMPKQVSAGLMFGGALSVPVPDVDRTTYLLVLGANPYESNGSLLTAPDLPGRLEALRARGGRLVVVDPRRTRTAEHADEHVAIRPGTDAHLLAAIAHVLFADDTVTLGAADGLVEGLDDVRAAVEPFTPDAVAGVCGVDASTIRRIAHELASAPAAAVYGRIGTCTQEFGTLASWLVDVVNVLTGNLDRPGGAMFATAAAGASNTRGTPGVGRGVRLGRRRSRVKGLPEAFGELPVATLADEIETPGDGRIRALVTVAGNPVLSTPHSARLDAALATLELVVSVDVYLNETTRHADVILPGPPTLSRGHYDLALYQLAVRNVANYSPPLVPLPDGQPDEWEILAKLALILQGQGASADPAAVEDLVVADLAGKASKDLGLDPAEVVAAVGDRRGPERVLDLMLRSGPYGDGFGKNAGGLSLDVLLANPHGVDLGPLVPRLPEVLRTASGRIELAPEPILRDVARLVASLGRGRVEGSMVLVGRRDLRSNNSWMHNVEVLVKGRPRCTLQVHPEDAARLGLVHGGTARVASRVGALDAPVEVTDGVMRGVVSLPHGWGHDAEGARLGVASRHAGVNSNVLTDPDALDPVSGNAVLNGIPVTVAPTPPANVGSRT